MPVRWGRSLGDKSSVPDTSSCLFGSGKYYFKENIFFNILIPTLWACFHHLWTCSWDPGTTSGNPELSRAISAYRDLFQTRGAVPTISEQPCSRVGSLTQVLDRGPARWSHSMQHIDWSRLRMRGRVGGREGGGQSRWRKREGKYNFKTLGRDIKERKCRAHCVSAQKAVAFSELHLQIRCILSHFRLKSLLNTILKKQNQQCNKFASRLFL